ncbi:MAG TPA: ATP-binding protein, partial [Candidatus Marinimicrobia bacterium]|nr:ATP-binding protein [Candidatus Neomarinimicrobiota bacterium]
MTDLFLGYHEHSKLTLSATSLQRHFACFGSSGSGKTVVSKVLIEELARNGIPVIAFDPQGDIASLAQLGNEADLERFNDLPEIRKSYGETTEVLIWTPASTRGIPLSLNPFNFSALDGLNSEEQIRFLANAAKNITALIGYDPGKNDGRAVEASFIIMFEYAVEKNIRLNSFKDLIAMMDNLPEILVKALGKVIDLKVLDSVNQKLSLYTVGTNRLLFDLSRPVGIEDLLGINSESGKTRVSIIYLNTLHNPEEKEFVIAVITEMLYQWMLKNPLANPEKALQCAYYIDEIAPYIPPVRKPACKESLTVLYKQARKYGVGCILSTQNPGDIDYKSIAQFSTMALGSLYTQQDIKKVRNRLDSLAPKDAERIANTLPGLEKGNFILLSPDNLKDVITMKSRWLVTEHKVLTETDIDRLTDDRLRQYYLKKDLPDEKTTCVEASSQASDNSSVTAGDNEFLMLKPQVYEKDLGKELKSHLAGGMIKKEKVGHSVLKYFPLIKTHIQIEQKKG